jgi:hypothetical protein
MNSGAPAASFLRLFGATTPVGTRLRIRRITSPPAAGALRRPMSANQVTADATDQQVRSFVAIRMFTSTRGEAK